MSSETLDELLVVTLVRNPDGVLRVNIGDVDAHLAIGMLDAALQQLRHHAPPVILADSTGDLTTVDLEVDDDED